MKRIIYILIGLILCLVILTACAGATAVVKPTEVAAEKPALEKNEEGYPVPGQDDAFGYPAPTGKIYGPDELPPVDETAPEPLAGKASISGTVFSYNSRVTVPDTVFYLVRVDGKDVPPMFSGPDTAKGDIVGRTDAEGKISMNDVLPGNYFLVVWSPYSWSLGVDPTKDPPPGRLIELAAGQKLPMGVVNISWP